MTPLEAARGVADAVLYEGYLLYPYRASAPKNQVRWQWGVLMPPGVVAVDESERSSNRTDVVLDGSDPSLRATVRFLQVQQRYVENEAGEPVERLDVGDTSYVPWDEAVERELVVDVPLSGSGEAIFDIPGGTEVEEVTGGRLVRVLEPLRVGVVTRAERPVSPYPVTMVTIAVENRTTGDTGENRPQWLRKALVACHLLLEAEGAAFVSQLDGPQWASGYVGACVNEGVFPVLAGPADQAAIMLSSPIILYDHPGLAPESETAFFDSLEIDELLSLRTMTLTDDEKREMRGTDPRGAALLAEVDHMPDELWERLHGAIRSVDPETDSVVIEGREVGRGTKVTLRPGSRQADAYDMFLAGRHATVAAVLHDVDGKDHLAVTVDDDPGSDLKLSHGRYLYFAPDEVEVLAEVTG